MKQPDVDVSPPANIMTFRLGFSSDFSGGISFELALQVKVVGQMVQPWSIIMNAIRAFARIIPYRPALERHDFSNHVTQAIT